MDAKKVLVVIDMQNDFITGALANEEAQKIIGAVAARIEACKAEGTAVFFTRDTHGQDYMDTQEGRFLPVPHCIKDSRGWQIIPELSAYAEDGRVLDKTTFGSLDLAAFLAEKLGDAPAEIELCGVCTDICVISNAMILKAAFPEVPVTVSGDLCAGVTVESHKNALDAMGVCQIIVK